MEGQKPLQGKMQNGPHCSKCGMLMDGFTATEPGVDPPGDGDYTVCAYCATIGVYSNNMTVIRELSFRDKIKLELIDPTFSEHLERVVQTIKMTSHIWKKP